MRHACVIGHAGWGGRFRILAGPVLFSLLLAACGATAAKPARPPYSVDLTVLLRMQPHRASVTLLPATPPHLSSLHFANAQDGWTGGQGVILATSDGGASWRRQYVGTGNVTGFSFLSPTLGFAATSAGLLKTDNGKTWSRVDAQPLYRVQFLNASEGFALEGQSQAQFSTYSLVATRDGGKLWRPLAAGAVAQACFFGSRIGIATVSGIGGTFGVERTTDGGVNWSTPLSIKGAVPIQLQCTKDGGAWLVAAASSESMSQQSYSVFRSWNEGASWSAVIAVSTAGDGPAPGDTAGAAQGPGSSPGPIGAVDRTTATMTGTCAACSDGMASFATTTDGGTTWSAATRPIAWLPSAPSTLDMLTARVGWLLFSPGFGGGQEIVETTDGGAAWHTILLAGPPTPTVATAFVNARVGYGIGTTGDPLAVLHTQDGGGPGAGSGRCRLRRCSQTRWWPPTKAGSLPWGTALSTSPRPAAGRGWRCVARHCRPSIPSASPLRRRAAPTALTTRRATAARLGGVPACRVFLPQFARSRSPTRRSQRKQCS